MSKRKIFLLVLIALMTIPAGCRRRGNVFLIALGDNIRTIDPIGAIGNYWATHHLPSPHELQLLQSLVDITAVTIENVNVYAE